MKLYDLARYYDIAFGWDPSHEVGVLKKIFDEQANGEVRRLLEPACGSGRMIRALEESYDILGYDNNPAMVDYAQEQGCKPEQVVLGDMASFRVDELFDAAFCQINSFRYLLEDAQIASHLQNTYDMLRPGGVYVVHMDLAYDGPLPDEDSDWECERDGVTIRTTWRAIEQDKTTMRCRELAEMSIRENDETSVVREEHLMRLWTEESWRSSISQNTSFEVVARYTDGGEAIDADRRLSGEDGNVYWVLKMG